MPFRPLTTTQPAPGPTPGFRPIGEPAAPPAPSLGEDIAQGEAKRLGTVKEALSARARGEQGNTRTIFQVAGQAIGAAVDPLVKTVAHATPDIVKKGLGSFSRTILPKLGENIEKTADAISNNKIVQKVADSPQGEAIGRDVEAFNEFLNLLPVPGSARAAGKVGEVVVDATKVPVAPFKKSYLPAVDDAFKKHGIKAPISAITKSPFLMGAESLASKSPFGRKIVEQVHAAEKAIEDKTNAIVSRITPAKTMSDENLGSTIQEGLREYEHEFKQTEEKVYAQFAKKYGKSDGTPNTTREVLASIVAEQGKDFFKGINPRFSKMLDAVSGETPDVKQMREQGMPEAVISASKTPPIFDFDELKATRTSVGEELARDPENTALKRLYGALSEDMKRVVQSVDAKNGGAALQKLNAQYKAGKDKIESHIASSIEQSNPERIAQNIIKRNSADTIKVVKEMIGPTRFQEVSKTFIRQQFESAITRGKFDVAKLKSNLAQFDQATVDEILSPEQLKSLNEAVRALDEMHALTEHLKPGKKYAEGSQTAYLQNITRMGAGAGAMFTALLAGQPVVAVGLLFGGLAEAGYAKMFTSDAGRKFLTEGLFSKRGLSVNDYLADYRAGKTTPRPLFGAPRDTKSNKPALPKDKRRDFFLKMQGQEDKIHGADDGEVLGPRR